MVHCMMHVAMNNEISRKFEKTQSEKILKVLNDSFGTPDDVERHKTSCTIFNTRMREGASVTDHVLYMIEQIECLSKLNFFLHEQLRKDAILNFLPKSYLPFLNHYQMTKPIVNYHGLLGLLQTFEKDHQLHKEMVNVVGGLLQQDIAPLRKKIKIKIKIKIKRCSMWESDQEVQVRSKSDIVLLL